MYVHSSDSSRMNCNLFEDPLDSEDFDAVKYINHRFPTGITSSVLLQLLIAPPIAAVACDILLYDDPVTSRHVTDCRVLPG